jgi:hypothetical protein
MGLQKPIDFNDTGVTVTYWHLSSRHDFFDLGRIELTFDGYVDEAAYKAGRKPVAGPLRYILVAEDFPREADWHNLSTKMLYQAVKTKAGKAAALAAARIELNPLKFPDVNGIPTNPALADAVDVGIS